MTDADNGGDVTLCEVVYDVRGISWTDDDNSRRRPNKYDNVPYRHRLFLTDQEIKQQQKHRRLCERTERRFFRLHGRRGKTLIDERGFALIDNVRVLFLIIQIRQHCLWNDKYFYIIRRS